MGTQYLTEFRDHMVEFEQAEKREAATFFPFSPGPALVEGAAPDASHPPAGLGRAWRRPPD